MDKENSRQNVFILRKYIILKIFMMKKSCNSIQKPLLRRLTAAGWLELSSERHFYLMWVRIADLAHKLGSRGAVKRWLGRLAAGPGPSRDPRKPEQPRQATAAVPGANVMHTLPTNANPGEYRPQGPGSGWSGPCPWHCRSLTWTFKWMIT